MRNALAEQLLAKIMEWSAEEVSKEIPLLQALANFKFDEYQQFSPGIRFIESLAQWLNQFNKIEEKRIAYNFIKTQLIFISNNQISQLVNLSFSTLIRPILIKKVADKLGINEYLIEKIITNSEYKKTIRQSLFIGLSDGSRIDQLRRYANLNNEQVLTTYYIDDEKAKELFEELELSCQCEKFTSIFLIDDFTASGTSYARFEEEKAKGKILKLIKKLYSEIKDSKFKFGDLIEKNGLSIHIIFYIATEDAISYLIDTINEYKNKHNIVDLNITIDAVQVFGSKVKDAVEQVSNFISIISNDEYFDENILDKHYRKGKHDKPYLGFNECALPLVLSHNTPNNSLPIIWFSEDYKIKGLFPRITRHKE